MAGDGIDGLNKRYSGIIQMPGAYNTGNFEYISTGSIALDFAIGQPGVRCGFPKGLITVIWGKEGSGKSTLSMSGMAQAQKCDDRFTALVNTEFRQDFSYAERIGVDLSRMALIEPNSGNGVFGEQLSDAIVEMAKSGDFSYILLDSIAALQPKVATEGETAESAPGVHARLVGKMISRVTGKIKESQTALVITSQRRSNFNSGPAGFGSPSYAIVGGNNLKFATSVMIQTAAVKQLKEKEEPIGIEGIAKLEKNIGISNKKVTFYIADGLGIDWTREMFDLGKPYNIAYSKGAWYYYIDSETGEEVTLGQGQRKATEFLRNNPELAAGLQNRIIKAIEGEYDKSN